MPGRRAPGKMFGEIENLGETPGENLPAGSVARGKRESGLEARGADDAGERREGRVPSSRLVERDRGG